jgi:exodeoxyribonuclease VII large subunit
VTGRLPFNPKRMSSSNTRGADDPWSVSTLADRIDTAIKQGLPKTVRVQGEISGFKDRTHWYFDLKDENAVVNVTMFASAARRSRAKPVNGQAFVITGRVEFYAPGGRTSLIATSITPVGLGELEQRYRELCEQIRALGWFEQDRKRPLPTFPKRIAIVTSRTGAALQDVIDTARRRMPAVELVLVDVRVQGAAAAGEVAHAIEALGRNHARLGLDAILITRGGGSMEDLWAFNEKIVAEAIVNAPIPVVAAIGHETDTTIAELVADLRCATPTQAAMKMIPDRVALVAQVDSLERRLRADVRRQLDNARRTIRTHERRPSLASPHALLNRQHDRLTALDRNLAAMVSNNLDHARTRLGHLESTLTRLSPRSRHTQRIATLDTTTRRLHDAITRRLDRTRTRVGDAFRHLEAVSPLKILERGYTITTDDTGRVLRSTSGINPGQGLKTRFQDGQVHSTADSAPDSPQPKSKPKPSPTRSSTTHKKPPPDDPPQMDLFAEGR